MDLVLPASGRQKRRLVHEVFQIGARKSRRHARDRGEACIIAQRHVSGVDLEDRLATGLVREVHHDAAIEPAGSQQRFVEHVGLIRRRQNDDPRATGEAVHLGEDLVQRLLLLARAANRERAAGAADRVQLVDEDDRRGILPRLPEEVSNPRRADAHDHLHEFRRAHGKEGSLRKNDAAAHS